MLKLVLAAAVAVFLSTQAHAQDCSMAPSPSPAPGAPTLDLGNGKSVAVTTYQRCDNQFYATVLYEDRTIGRNFWQPVQVPFAFWKVEYKGTRLDGTPCLQVGGNDCVADGETLEGIVESHGGPVPFVLDFMSYATKQIATLNGFNVTWSKDFGELNSFITAISAWQLEAIQAVPGLFVTAPK